MGPIMQNIASIPVMCPETKTQMEQKDKELTSGSKVPPTPLNTE